MFKSLIKRLVRSDIKAYAKEVQRGQDGSVSVEAFCEDLIDRNKLRYKNVLKSQGGYVVKQLFNKK
jgi:hypothetical protein